MNNFILETETARFRPVTMADAEFIVMLRNLPHVNGYIHKTSLNVDFQRQWIADYLKRDNEYYWIIESKDGKAIGTTSFYNYNRDKNQIESGRWIQIPGVVMSSFSGEVLLKDFAFNVLNLRRIVSDTVVTNKQVIRYHRFLGEEQIGIREELGTNGSGTCEIASFEETAERWPKNRRKLVKFCGDESDRIVYRIEPDGTLSRIKFVFK